MDWGTDDLLNAGGTGLLQGKNCFIGGIYDLLRTMVFHVNIFLSGKVSKFKMKERELQTG